MRSGYSADGTIVWLDFPNAPKAAKASVSTFVIGYLVIQVVSVHHEPEHENAPVRGVTIRDGEWDKLLVTYLACRNAACDVASFSDVQ